MESPQEFPWIQKVVCTQEFTIFVFELSSFVKYSNLARFIFVLFKYLVKRM